jgi:hypothetical protein
MIIVNVYDLEVIHKFQSHNSRPKALIPMKIMFSLRLVCALFGESREFRNHA